MTDPNVPGRRMQRVPLTVELTATGHDQIWLGFTQNISAGGVFVATPTIAPIGTRFELTLTVPGLPGTWALHGEVRWSRGEIDGLAPGLGLRFLDLPPEVSQALQAFILSQRDSLFYDED